MDELDNVNHVRNLIMRTGRLRVSGISCAGWARELQHTLQSVNGVNEVKVIMGSGDAEVQFDEQLTSFDDLKIALMQEGFSFQTSGAYAA